MSAQKKKEFLRAITNFVVNRQKSLRTSCFYDRIVERTVKSGRGRNYHAENCRRYQVRRRQSTFVWKHPCEDFNTNTQLIVHESQEAIFFMNGLALDLFGPGRYTLETQNIPLVRNFINLPTDGVSAFHCEVYFVNKTEQMALRWGTDSKV